MARPTRRPEPPLIDLRALGYDKLDASHITGTARRKLAKMQRSKLREELRAITPQLLQEMARIALMSQDGDAQKFKALKDLLDRGWGTPSQAPGEPPDEDREAGAVKIVGGLPD